jgi:hypothetical protein
VVATATPMPRHSGPYQRRSRRTERNRQTGNGISESLPYGRCDSPPRLDSLMAHGGSGVARCRNESAFAKTVADRTARFRSASRRGPSRPLWRRMHGLTVGIVDFDSRRAIVSETQLASQPHQPTAPIGSAPPRPPIGTSTTQSTILDPADSRPPRRHQHLSSVDHVRKGSISGRSRASAAAVPCWRRRVAQREG